MVKAVMACRFASREKVSGKLWGTTVPCITEHYRSRHLLAGGIPEAILYKPPEHARTGFHKHGTHPILPIQPAEQTFEIVPVTIRKCCRRSYAPQVGFLTAVDHRPGHYPKRSEHRPGGISPAVEVKHKTHGLTSVPTSDSKTAVICLNRSHSRKNGIVQRPHTHGHHTCQIG